MVDQPDGVDQTSTIFSISYSFCLSFLFFPFLFCATYLKKALDLIKSKVSTWYQSLYSRGRQTGKKDYWHRSERREGLGVILPLPTKKSDQQGSQSILSCCRCCDISESLVCLIWAVEALEECCFCANLLFEGSGCMFLVQTEVEKCQSDMLKCQSAVLRF